MITHAFDWVQTSVGIFVGLSIARLVTSAVNMHIARKNVAMDWIPFVWAVTIFVLLIQFSWTFCRTRTDDRGLDVRIVFEFFGVPAGFIRRCRAHLAQYRVAGRQELDGFLPGEWTLVGPFFWRFTRCCSTR